MELTGADPMCNTKGLPTPMQSRTSLGDSFGEKISLPDSLGI